MKKAPPPPCVAGEKTNGTISNLSTHEVMAHHLSEDCAINELLEGNMDLEVVLPDSKTVRMTVERRIPMMDLLVQVTKANKISPGGHFISLSPNNKDNLHYKPNTPIGSLDTNTIYIMSKSAMNDQPAAKMLRSQSQPFEKTFRLQVNLPKKQLMVVRVSPKTTLAEIKKMICTEKKLEYSQYYLVHPSQPSYLIDLNYSLSEYGCTEVSLVNKSTMNSTISNSTSDLIGYPISMTEDEKKKKKLLNIFKRKSKSVNNMMLAGEAFKDTARSRGVSPARSDICDTHSLRTKRQSTKKRAPPPPPLPPPPPPVQPQPEVTAEAEISTKTNSSSSEPVSTTVGSTTIITTMVSHSRQSSDSSGYHEASVLSDSPDNLSPETSGGSGSSGIHSTDNTEQENQKVAVSKSNSRLKTREKPNFSSVAHSVLILNANKKRKAPPPPPPPQPNVNKETMKSNTEINAISSEKDITPVSNDENDLPSKTVTEVKPVTIEIVNDSSNKDATSVQKGPDPDSCISPIKNGVDSILSEQGDASPLSSPTNSSPSHNDSLNEPETPDSNTKNHRHTEEETGEVIHFLEKGEISSKSSIIQELISDFIPPPLEFSTPSTPTEYVNTNEKKPEPIPRTNVNRDDSFKTKTFPTPHPRLTLQNSSTESNKSCRRSLNFSDQPSDQKTIEKDKTAIHLHDTHTVEDKVSNEDTKTTINCSDEMSINPIRKDDDDDKELIPNSLETNEEAVEISDPEWDFSIPEPPSPFRNNRDNSNSLESELFKKDEVHLFPENNDIENIIDYNALKEITETPRAENSDCLQDKADDDLIDNYPPSLPETMPPRDKCFRVGSMSSDIPPPLPISDPPESAREKSYSFCSTSSEVSFPEFDPSQREHDTNSAYKEFKTVSKNETDDIKKVDDDKFVGISRIDITNQESISTQTYIVVPQPKRRPHLENFTIGSYKNEKTNSGVTDSSFSASLTDTDKSSNLIKTNSFPKDNDKESNKVNKPTYNFTIMPFKSRNSYNENKVDQNKDSDELLQEEKVEEVRNKNQMPFKSTGREEETKIEQRQLEEEYQKLQNQLLVWQQQLVKNQTLLQEKQIVPEMSVPDLSPLCSQLKVEEKSSVAQRSRTLPRPKPNVNKELVEQTHSSTVEYYSQPKSQILKNVTIGSWERKPEITVGTVAEVKPKFQNENKSQVNNSVVDKCKKSSVLLEDNEKNKISQISAKFDIKSSNNKTAVANNMPENLEDAPPAVILAQIRKEMKANAKYPAGTVINSESKKGTSVSKTYIRPKSQIIYSHYNSASDDRISDLTKSSSQDPIKVNGNINTPVVVATIKSKPALDKDVVNGDKNTVSLPVSSSVSIPPPPLPPVVPINKNSSKFQSTSHLLKVSKTEPLSDPREELMIEIRNFGGRKALRKVPLNQAGWHLKVFGTLSSSSV